jgi:hypothetical protein
MHEPFLYTVYPNQMGYLSIYLLRQVQAVTASGKLNQSLVNSSTEISDFIKIVGRSWCESLT